MKIFIAGATGFVGGHLTDALRQRGHELVLLTHNRRRTTEPGFSYVTGDVSLADSYADAMNGCDAVINLVGIIREFAGKGITFERLHVQAAHAMTSAAKRAGVTRYLQMSALGTRADAVSDYHRTKWMAEEIVRASGLEWTIFRPSLIFGPHDAFVNMLADQLRMLPVLPTMGDGNYRLQPIHGDDVANCFSDSLEKPETIGQTYCLCGPDRMSYRELLDAIASALGSSAPLKPALPLGLMKPVISILQNFRLFPITLDQLQMLLEESICDGSWQQTFTKPPVRFEEGIKKYLGNH